MKFINYLTPIVAIISIGLLFYLTKCEPTLTTPSVVESHYPHELIEEVLNQLDSARAEIDFYKAKVIELENLPPKIQYSTRVQTQTIRDTFTQTIVDSTSLYQLQQLEEFLASLDLETPPIPSPTYFSHFEDPYITLTTLASEDTTNFSLKTRETIVLNHLRERKLFKRDEYIVEAYSTSPYSEIIKVESIKLRERPRKVGISFTIGYGTSITDGAPTLTPNATIGLSYTPIKF